MTETTQTKAALVFGGSRGIGAAAVARLAADGYHVGFTYASREDKAREVAEGVRAAGGDVLAIQADSSDADAIQAAVDATVAKFGPLHVVVVNAGLALTGRVDAVPLEDLDRMLDVNVRGVFLSIQATVPHLVDRARVITIGSIVAIRTGTAGASVYQLTKAAVAGMVKGVALDLAPRGITVNNIQPGPIDTDINTGALDALADKSPLKRVGQPEEVAGLIAYLAADESHYITGASITIDGGYTL